MVSGRSREQVEALTTVLLSELGHFEVSRAQRESGDAADRDLPAVNLRPHPYEFFLYYDA